MTLIRNEKNFVYIRCYKARNSTKNIYQTFLREFSLDISITLVYDKNVSNASEKFDSRIFWDSSFFITILMKSDVKLYPFRIRLLSAIKNDCCIKLNFSSYTVCIFLDASWNVLWKVEKLKKQGNLQANEASSVFPKQSELP